MATERRGLFLEEEQEGGMTQTDIFQIRRQDMTPILENSSVVNTESTVEETVVEDGDIPIDMISGTGTLSGSVPNNLSGVVASNVGTFPAVIPNNPVFTVPANPLLPEEYNELLDYNTLQYMNGFFRTQIGRYVRVEQLIGSNIQQEFDGFLIGVGVNYIILQEYSNQNIRVMDIYSIKNMQIYYSELAAMMPGRG